MYLVNSKCKLQAILEIWLLYIFPFAICTEESHVILLAIDRHLNCSPYAKTDDILQKQVFGYSSQLLYVQVNTTKFYL